MVKKMKNTNNTIKTAIAILAILLFTSIVMITNISRNTATAQFADLTDAETPANLEFGFRWFF